MNKNLAALSLRATRKHLLLNTYRGAITNLLLTEAPAKIASPFSLGCQSPLRLHKLHRT